MNKIITEPIKQLTILYLLVVAIGVGVGLVYLFYQGQISPNGIVENYRGSKTQEEFEVPDKYEKPIGSMLVSTHNHILGLAPIILSLCLIYYVVKNGKVSLFIMIEPLVSLSITFGSIWLVRYIHSSFVYLTILSGILMYFSICFLIISSIAILIRRKNEQIERPA